MTVTLTEVDGKAVIERQSARFGGDEDSARPHNVTPHTLISSIDELLLADGSTVFHCVHKNAVNCTFTAAGRSSVMSHQRTHSDRMEAKRAKEKADGLTAQLAQIEAEKEQKRANYSAGAKKGLETRRAKLLQTPSEVGGAGNGMRTGAKIGEPSKSVIGDADLARKAQQVIIAYNALQDAHDEFQNVFLGYMRAAQVATAEKPVIDPQILAKARQYDIIQNALKGAS